jgi:hypothetical protein
MASQQVAPRMARCGPLCIHAPNPEDAMDLYYCNTINNGKPASCAKDGKVWSSLDSWALAISVSRWGIPKQTVPIMQSKQVAKARTNKHKIPRHKCKTCGKEHRGRQT